MNKVGKNNEETWVALIGRIQNESAITHRDDFHDAFRELLDDLSVEIGRAALPVPMELAGGHGLRGLFRDPVPVVGVVSRLAEQLHPVRFAFGLGHGPLGTELRDSVNAMDGPCFHEAEKALGEARKRGGLVARGFGAPHDAVLSSLFRLMDAVRSGWTRKQNLYCRESRDMLQKDVAAKYRKSPSVISQAVKATHFDAIREAERAAMSALEACRNPGGAPDSR